MKSLEFKGRITHSTRGCEPDGQDYARLGNLAVVMEPGRGPDGRMIMLTKHILEQCDNGVVEIHLALGEALPVLAEGNQVSCAFTDAAVTGELCFRGKVISVGAGEPHHTWVLEGTEGPQRHIGVHTPAVNLDWKVGEVVNIGIKLLGPASENVLDEIKVKATGSTLIEGKLNQTLGMLTSEASGTAPAPKASRAKKK